MQNGNYGGPIITQRPTANIPNTGMVKPPQVRYAMPKPVRHVYIDRTTKNKSFLDMSNFLRSTGRRNCDFMLTIIDPDLIGVDPFDPHLSYLYKQKILRECICNYWYYLREVVRIPDQGGTSVRFKLTRANLATNFLMSLNINTFEEIPRQQGKTVSAAARYLYVFNFGTTNSKMGFFHKNMDGSKSNLQTLKDIRDLLPEYLIMKEMIGFDGKVVKGKNNTTIMKNPHNNNVIKAFASATNKAKAASLVRGLTLTSMWFDEYGFLVFNDIIYMNAMPAFKTAADNAKKNGSPYGILITTTPGFMTTDEGKEAYALKEASIPFSETWYDKTYKEIMEIIDANKMSNFVYVKYSYQQLGCSEEWFNEICKQLKWSYPDIRREILLEWSTGVENSPFKEEDLNAIGRLVKTPIAVNYLLGKYRFETYMRADTNTYPPILGVDVANGYKKDSSTITVIDSQTTKVMGCLNCNYISVLDLARCIEFIVKQWLPNAIINVERNGGYGSSVIAKLLKLGLRRNLYYEIKDIVTEERQDGIHSYKKKIRTKVYGLNSTKDIRKLLIDILIDRVENHKDKFNSPIIYNELLGMEIKKNGKVEHSASTHDDQVFSMLMALYVWYEGVNLYERFGLRKATIKTDEEIDEALDYADSEGIEIVGEFNVDNDNPVQEQAMKDYEVAKNNAGILMQDYLDSQYTIDKQTRDATLKSDLGQKAFREMYNIPADVNINNLIGTEYGGNDNIPNNIFTQFYADNTNDLYKENNFNLMVSQNPEDLEDGEYKYEDHFNF